MKTTREKLLWLGGMAIGACAVCYLLEWIGASLEIPVPYPILLGSGATVAIVVVVGLQWYHSMIRRWLSSRKNSA